jgi:hypothetical protein
MILDPPLTRQVGAERLATNGVQYEHGDHAADSTAVSTDVDRPVQVAGMTSTRPPPAERHTTVRETIALSRAECLSLLEQQPVGRLNFVVDGWASVLPMNYALEGGDIVIRTGAGTKFSALRHGAQVSLQIDAIDPVYRSGWSVLVFGYATEVIDESALAHVESLGLRSWEGGDKDFWIRIRPVQVTGRRLPKAWQYPDPVDEL